MFFSLIFAENIEDFILKISATYSFSLLLAVRIITRIYKLGNILISH